MASGLAPIEAKLAELLETLKGGKAAAVGVLTQVESIRAELRVELPDPVPPLDTLEIVED